MDDFNGEMFAAQPGGQRRTHNILRPDEKDADGEEFACKDGARDLRVGRLVRAHCIENDGNALWAVNRKICRGRLLLAQMGQARANRSMLGARTWDHGATGE